MKNRNYKIDFSTNTITINKAFRERMYNPNSEEYQILARLQTDFPNLRIKNATHNTTKKKPQSKITYDRMVKYISCQPDATLLLKIFANVRELSKGKPSSYNSVLKWFKESFPCYYNSPQFDDNGDLIAQYDLAAIIKSNPEAQTAETAQEKIILEEELSHAA